MSDTLLTTKPRSSLRPAAWICALATAALAAGCAKHDSITVGAVPDDYRTNHPIVISEKDKVVDIPVGAADRSLSRMQRAAVDGFIAGYDRGSAAPVSVLTPYGSANQAAASRIAADMVKRLRAAGVPEGRIVHQPYEASRYGDSAPIRLVYAEMRASAGPCGRWPADLMDTADNKHWANFGCSYQNNLAAQIANPADLLGPRKSGDIDPPNRSDAIEQYRRREIAPDMRSNREVVY